MRRPLVAIALLLAFAAQLVLSGVGAACAMPSTDAMGAGSSAAMSAMAMTGSHESDDRAPAPREGRDSCDTQIPTAICQLMSACTAPAIAVGMELASAGSRVTTGAIPFLSTSPALHSTVPELPPPRA